MNLFVRRSFLIFTILMLIASPSYANLKKGKIGSGSKLYEFVADVDGVIAITLIYDKFDTDLDLAIGLEDETLIAVSVSPERNYETLHVGLVGGVTYLLSVDHYEGGATPFRLIINSAAQEDVGSAGVVTSSLREIETSSVGSKLTKSLHTVQKIKQK